MEFPHDESKKASSEGALGILLEKLSSVDRFVLPKKVFRSSFGVTTKLLRDFP
jgi:hypothetical protein